MLYQVRLALECWHKPTEKWHNYSTVQGIRAVSRKHACNKGLAALKRWPGYQDRAGHPDWNVSGEAKIVEEENMKKIAQGRARRRDRQLEAAERQALFTERNLAQAQKQLAAYQQDLKRTKGEVMAAIQLCPVATQRLVERQADRAQKLAARLLEDQHRLQQLRAGNYPL